MNNSDMVRRLSANGLSRIASAIFLRISSEAADSQSPSGCALMCRTSSKFEAIKESLSVVPILCSTLMLPLYNNGALTDKCGTQNLWHFSINAVIFLDYLFLL